MDATVTENCEQAVIKMTSWIDQSPCHAITWKKVVAFIVAVKVYRGPSLCFP